MESTKKEDRLCRHHKEKETKMLMSVVSTCSLFYPFLPLRIFDGPPSHRWGYLIKPHPTQLCSVHQYEPIWDSSNNIVRAASNEIQTKAIDYFNSSSSFFCNSLRRLLAQTVKNTIVPTAMQKPTTLRAICGAETLWLLCEALANVRIKIPLQKKTWRPQ